MSEMIIRPTLKRVAEFVRFKLCGSSFDEGLNVG